MKAKLVRTGSGYVSWGVSKDYMMVGSEAIMALPTEGSVLKYEMISKENYYYYTFTYDVLGR